MGVVLSHRFGIAWALVALGMLSGCASLPEQKVTRYRFPKNVFTKDPGRAYRKIGVVRAKVDYSTLNPNWEEDRLCKNYFNKAASDLLKSAKAKGADAVVEMRSVVFLIDGRTESYPQAECSDDGSGGQVLAQGFAVKWEDPKEVEREARLKAREAQLKEREARLKAWQEGKLEPEPTATPVPDSTEPAEKPAKAPKMTTGQGIDEKTPQRIPRPQDLWRGTD